jgi:hypothetical protein
MITVEQKRGIITPFLLLLKLYRYFKYRKKAKDFTHEDTI